jgi:serine/threonine protein kinase
MNDQAVQNQVLLLKQKHAPKNIASREPEAPIASDIPGYQFLQALGEGGFGEVKLAKHLLTGEKVYSTASI